MEEARLLPALLLQGSSHRSRLDGTLLFRVQAQLPPASILFVGAGDTGVVIPEIFYNRAAALGGVQSMGRPGPMGRVERTLGLSPWIGQQSWKIMNWTI
jgi:hypothetical protein